MCLGLTLVSLIVRQLAELPKFWKWCRVGNIARMGCCQKLRWGTEKLYVVTFILNLITQYSKLFVLTKWIAQITEILWLSNNRLVIQGPLQDEW